MSPRIPTFAAAASLLLAACATHTTGLPSPPAAALKADVTPEAEAATEAPAVEAAAPEVAAQEPAQEPAPAQESGSQATLREIWAKPSFQRRLAQNWLRGGEVDPPLTLREGEFRQEVRQLISDDDIEDATARLQSLQGPESSPVWDFMLGNLHFGREQYAEAARELTKAVGKYPSYRRAWQMLGFAQMRASKFTSAVESFVEVIGLGGGDAQTYGFLGVAHAQAGEFTAAESAFRLVMMMDPRDDRWKKLLAESLGRQGKYAECISLINSLIAKDRDNVEMWKMQANAFANMGDTESAATSFEIIDRLGGADYVTLANLGTIYFNDGLFSMAVDAYLRALQRPDRGSHEAALAVANSLATRSAYEEAGRLVAGVEEAYAATLSSESKMELLKLRARLAVASGATEEQVALLHKIVESNPLDGDALIQLARHYQGAGDVEQAEFRYEQAARNPDFTARAKVLHGQLLANQQRFAEAEPLLEAALQLKRSDDVSQLLEYVKRAKARAASKKSGA